MSNPALDPVIKQLMESAAIGEAAKTFLQSGLGSHITQRASDEADAAMSALINVDPTNAAQVAALQLRIRVATQAIAWLTEAMAEGENALRQLHEDS